MAVRSISAPVPLKISRHLLLLEPSMYSEMKRSVGITDTSFPPPVGVIVSVSSSQPSTSSRSSGAAKPVQGSQSLIPATVTSGEQVALASAITKLYAVLLCTSFEVKTKGSAVVPVPVIVPCEKAGSVTSSPLIVIGETPPARLKLTVKVPAASKLVQSPSWTSETVKTGVTVSGVHSAIVRSAQIVAASIASWISCKVVKFCAENSASVPLKLTALIQYSPAAKPLKVVA